MDQDQLQQVCIQVCCKEPMIKKRFNFQSKNHFNFPYLQKRISWNALDKNLSIYIYNECLEFMKEYQNNKVWPYCEILIRSRELEDSGAEALGLQHLGGGLVVDTWSRVDPEWSVQIPVHC